MRLAEMVDLPRHLLAATVERGRERFPVKVKHVGRTHLVVSRVPLEAGERARVTIVCPLSSVPCEVTAFAVKLSPDAAWLSLVA